MKYGYFCCCTVMDDITSKSDLTVVDYMYKAGRADIDSEKDR